MQLDECGATGDPCIRVGHRYGHALVQRQHELHLWIVLQDVHEALLGGARVAKDVRHTIGDQLLEERAFARQSRHVC